MAAVTPPQPQQDAELEYLTGGTLARRRDGVGASASGVVGVAGGGGEAPAAAKPSRHFCYRKNADYDSLIEACSSKLVSQPNNVRALMIRANSYVKKGAHTGGECACDPSHLACCVCTGAGHWPGPSMHMHHLQPIFFMSRSRPAHTRLRTFRRRPAGRLEAALSDYSRVLRCQPSNIDAAYQRGLVNQKLRSNDEAISDFSLVLQLDPNHAKAAYARAICNNVVGRFDEAHGKLLSGWFYCICREGHVPVKNFH